MNRTILTIAFALIAGAASAQIPMKEPVRTYDRASRNSAAYLSPGNPLQQKAAAQLTAQAGVACEMTDAGVVKESHRAGPRTVTYEVACKDDFGWIVTSTAGKVSAYDCLALETSEKASRGKLATCRLEKNVSQTGGLASLARKAGLTCKPVEGVYIGGGGEPAISRYEVLCDNGAGYVIDAPQPRSDAAMLAMSCARAKAVGMGVCRLKPGKG